MIRHATPSDANNICDIYNEYVQNTRITFEEEPVSPSEMAERIKTITEDYPWLVYEDEELDEVIGYTYATKWKKRSAYRHSVESAIYLNTSSQGQGIGTKLKKALLVKLEEQDIHTVISGIALPNPVSIALFEKLGFEKVAHFHEVGYKFNKWVNVGYWQLIL